MSPTDAAPGGIRERQYVNAALARPVESKLMSVSASEPSDEVLAARAAAGDDAAFERLVARYQRRVFHLACRLTNATDAPDVVQETFLQVYRHLSTFRGDAQFSTWIYRIATN